MILHCIIVDVTCFYTMFVPQDPIINSFSYPVCAIWSGAANNLRCILEAPHTGSVSFVAPLIYSDQCFSSILTNCKFNLTAGHLLLCRISV